MDHHDALDDKLTGMAGAIEVGDSLAALEVVRGKAVGRRRKRNLVGGTLAVAALVGASVVVVGAVSDRNDSDSLSIAGASDDDVNDDEATDGADTDGADTDVAAEAADADATEPSPGEGDSAANPEVEPAADGAAPSAPPANAGVAVEQVSSFDAASTRSETSQDGATVETTEWLVPWKDGFLAGRSSYVPQQLPALPQEVIDLFPAEVVEFFNGELPPTIEEATRMLSEAGLLDEVTAVLSEHPEASEAIYAAPAPQSSQDVLFSSDGQEWESIEFTAPDTAGQGLWGVQSTGDRLALATQVYDQTDFSDGGPPEGKIVMFTTTDLVNWDAVDIPSAAPADLPAEFRYQTFPESFAINDRGWVVRVGGHAEIDLEKVLPADVWERMQTNGHGWSTDDTGISVDFQGDFAVESGGGDAPPTSDVGEPPLLERLSYTWEELGLEPAVYDRFGGTPQGSVWFADWGSAAEVTESSSRQFVGASDGFYAIDRESIAYSADGRSWSSTPLPDGFENGSGVTAVPGGVVAVGFDADGGSEMYRFDRASSTWTVLDIPGAPASLSGGFGPENARGVFIIDGAQRPEPEPTELTVESDGFVLVMNQNRATVRVRVTDPAGELVIDETHDWTAETQPVSWGQDIRGLIALDPESGDELVVFGSELMEQAYREQAGSFDDVYEDYQSDLWLLATLDGSRWLVHDVIDGERDGGENGPSIGPAAAAINDTTVLANFGGEWVSFALT